jgi:hypothetical protein
MRQIVVMHRERQRLHILDVVIEAEVARLVVSKPVIFSADDLAKPQGHIIADAQVPAAEHVRITVVRNVADAAFVLC